MPRPLRVEYEGARYHVMCRGNRDQVVFGSADDCRLFLKTLSESVQRAGFVVHAYALMKTHYHLLIETPNGNLVESMKWLQGAFTQRMNAMHQTWGHPTFISRCRRMVDEDRALKSEYEALCNYLRAGK